MTLITQLQNDNFSCIENMKFRCSRKYAERCATALDSKIQEMDLLTPKEAIVDPTLKAVRNFFKKINPKFKLSGKIKDCWDRFRAAKLGITPEVLQDNPTFDEFTKRFPLERYLAEYDKQVLLLSDDELNITYEGVYTPWKTVYANISKELEEQDILIEKSGKNPDKFYQPWYYGPKGIQVGDMYDWNKLESFNKELREPDDQQHYFEYCVCCSDDKLRLQGDHSWFRLVDGNGNVYSAGKNLRRKLDGNPIFPLRAKPGAIMSPDVSEFWPIKIHKLRVKITPDQFTAIKGAVEQSKQKTISKFQIFKSNCQGFVNKMAKIADLELPTSYSVVRLITHKSLQNIYDKINPKLPKTIQKIFRVIGTFFANLILVILGNGVTDSLVKKHHINYKPKIESWKDLFDPEKLKFHPPYYAQKVFAAVEKWQKLEEGREFSLPDQNNEIQREELESLIKAEMS